MKETWNKSNKKWAIKIKKINVKASQSFAEIKTETILSSLKSVVASHASDSVDESNAPILAWNCRGVLGFNTFSVLVELSPQTANSIQIIVSLNTAWAVSSWWVESVASWADIEALSIIISPLSHSTGGDGDAKSIVKFVFFRGTVEAFSSWSVEVSAGWAYIVAIVVDEDLPRFALFSKDTFSGVHEEVVWNTFCAGSSLSVENATELVNFMAEIVLAQVLSGGALVWLFNLEADSVLLKSVGWDTS